MTGPLAPLFAQVREALDAESDGFCAWCQCSIHEQPHASECEGRRALAALSAIERHVQDMGEFVRNQELAAERAMRRASGEGYTYEQGRRDAFFEVRDRTERAALPAREKGTE